MASTGTEVDESTVYFENPSSRRQEKFIDIILWRRKNGLVVAKVATGWACGSVFAPFTEPRDEFFCGNSGSGGGYLLG